MYKTILVPLDGSKRAENILKHLEPLAFCYGIIPRLGHQEHPASRTVSTILS